METKSLDQFNSEYLKFHTRKEDLFWATYMGHPVKEGAFVEAESQLKTYLSDPIRLKEVRAALENESSPQKREALIGWERVFSCNTIENEKARALRAELIQMEDAIFQKRANLTFEYTDSNGKGSSGSSNVAAANISASADEVVRKTSHDSLLRLEEWVLQNGYIELVKKRNEFARALGYENFFSYRVLQAEGISVSQLWPILEEFEKLTRETCLKGLKDLETQKGPSAVQGHNVKFSMTGDLKQKSDPYFPFKKSLRRWIESFSKLGIRYRAATLTLDLLDRKGKYENGFMHGPGPAYFNNSQWQPARISFTSNATPNQVGSGHTGIMTFFHEGGHAAHFANVQQNSPCFSIEFPPTSMAFAETQSMFCDSLLGDAEWMVFYAKDQAGNGIPTDLIQQMVTRSHPFQAFVERSILVVPYFEKALYEMPDSELTPERILKLARKCEKQILGLDCSPRPMLAIPHLLSDDSSCTYQGYLLAHMAVYQTRAYFLKRDGYLVDNPKIGPDLETYYWKPGNKITHTDAVKTLTGAPLSGRTLAEHCNLESGLLWEKSKQRMDAALARAKGEPPFEMPPNALDAKIHIVHGTTEISNNLESDVQMILEFESWIDREYPC